MARVIEVCCYSVRDALIAFQAGAGRVELCSDIFSGGTTPSLGFIEYVAESMPIDVVAMIRPRGGDFLYSRSEVDVMMRDIDGAFRAGARYVALGALTKDACIDKDITNELVQKAHSLGMEVTFHRAFDLVRDPEEALEDLINLGMNRVLTSGQRQTAAEGADLIEKLVRLSGDKIKVVAGGGVRPWNLEALLKTGVKEIHIGSLKAQLSQRDLVDSGVHVAKTGLDSNLNYFIDRNVVEEVVHMVLK